MSIRTLLAAVAAVAVVLAVFPTLQAYQQTAVKRLVIAEPWG
jgi:hypothetical protein